MNGKTFDKLSNLIAVWLGNNECIRENFNPNAQPTSLAQLSQTISESCGSCRSLECEMFEDLKEIQDENARRIENSIGQLLEEQMNQNKILEAHIKSTSDKNENLQISLAQRETELNALKDLKDRYESEIMTLKDFTDKIYQQRNETCGLKTDELENIVSLKLREIEQLTDDLQKKTSELNEKDRKFKELEEKIKIMTNSNQW